MVEVDFDVGTGRVRGVYMRMLLQALERLPDAHRDAVIERVAPVQAAVTAAPRMSWLPFETNYQLTLALEEECGREGMQEFFRHAFLNVWSSNLLRALTEFVLRLTGKDIQAAARNFGRGFPQLFREVGTWQVVHSAPGDVLVEFSDFPDRALDRDNMWLCSVVGSLTSLYDYAEIEGTLELEGVTSEGGVNRAQYAFRY